MGVKTDEVDAVYQRVKLVLTTSGGQRFFAEIAEDGIFFRSDTSSLGALYGKPIKKTADELLDWIGSEGDRKPFRDRRQVKATGYS